MLASAGRGLEKLKTQKVPCWSLITIRKDQNLRARKRSREYTNAQSSRRWRCEEVVGCDEVHTRRGGSKVGVLYPLHADDSRTGRIGRFSFILYFRIPK